MKITTKNKTKKEYTFPSKIYQRKKMKLNIVNFPEIKMKK